MENEDRTPSDEELQDIVGRMDIVPALHIDPEDGKNMTRDAYNSVMALAELMTRGSDMLAAGEADSIVTLGYDHEARCVYAELEVVALVGLVMTSMNAAELERNDLTNGAVFPVARIDHDTGNTNVRLFLKGR